MKLSLLMMSFTVLVLSGTTYADQDLDVQDLLDRLQALEKTVETQREEIETLKAGQGHNKTSSYETIRFGSAGVPVHGYGAPETEVHNAVKDYLASKEGKELIIDASPAKIDIGYNIGEGFYIETLDDKYRVEMSNLTQIRYTFADNDHSRDTSSFRIGRHLIIFQGHALSKNLTYRVQWNLTPGNGAGVLDDVYGDYRIADWLQFRGGQYKVPYNRQELTFSGNLQFVDRSIASQEFNLDRDIGIMTHAKPMEGLFEYYLAMMTGAGRNRTRNTNNQMLYAARLAVNPLGEFNSYSEPDLEYEESPKLALGAAFAWNNGSQMFVRDAIRDFNRAITLRQFTSDLTLKWRGLSILGDFYWRNVTAHSGESLFQQGSNRGYGYTVQGGYFVPLPAVQKHLEFTGRYSFVDPNTRISGNSERELGGGVNWFVDGNTFKLQADVMHITTEKVPPCLIDRNCRPSCSSNLSSNRSLEGNRGEETL